MATSAETIATIEAEFNYVVDTGVKPVNETMGPGNMARKRTGTYEAHTLPVRDGRPLKHQFKLDVDGFEFVDHPIGDIDFFDPEQVTSRYYPSCVDLIKKHTGATRVHVFDHTLRSGDEGTRNEKLIREPVKSVHNDYTEWSGPQRVRDLLPDEADELLKHRFAIIQVWRAINKPIESDPLAIADARSLEEKDLLASERRYPNRVGETYQIKYNPNHRWFWFPRMARDEAIIFKVYDSAKDGRARWTAHSAFTDPTAPASALPRESCELRSIAFFGPEER